MAPPINNPEDEEAVKQSVALEGARYIQRIITPEDILGIAWEVLCITNPIFNPCRRTKLVLSPSMVA